MLVDKLLVLSNPLDGQDDEYNRWYTDRHIPDVLAVNGVVSAQRFQVRELRPEDDAMPGNTEGPSLYAAIYDIEGHDPIQVFDALRSKIATGEIMISPSLDLNSIRLLALNPLTSLVRAGGITGPAGAV